MNLKTKRILPALAAAVALAAIARADELEIARNALRDGLWDIAISHADAAARAADPLFADRARIVLLEALAGSGREAEIPTFVDGWGPPVSDGCRYWKGWAQAKIGDYDAAAETLAAGFSDSGYRSIAGRLKARIAAEIGNRGKTDAAYAEVAATAVGEAKIANAVEWAHAIERLGDPAAAFAVLEKEGVLAASGKNADHAKLLAASLRRRSGDAAGADAILSGLVNGGTNVCEEAYVRAATELSAARESAGATAAALDFAARAAARAADPAMVRLAGFRMAFLRLADPATRSNGVAAVRALVREAPGEEDSRAAQLQLAGKLLDFGDPAAAKEYLAYLETWPGAALESPALEGYGRALLALGRCTEAFGLFSRAAETAPDAETRARCEFQEAEALSLDGKYDEAASLYALVASRNAGAEIAETALFNRACALKHSGKEERAAEAFREVADLGGRLASEAEMEIAAWNSAHGRVDEALGAYAKILAEHASDPAIALAARVGRGRAYYRDYRFEEAAADFSWVAERDPSRRPAMRFLGALCRYGSGDDAAAEREARETLAEYPDSPLVPEIALWLAKFDSNRGEHAAASKAFAAYAAKWPEAPHAAEALVWGAREACSANDFTRAVELVTEAVKRYPASAALPEGLFVQGEALMELARFDEAAVVLERAALSDPQSSRSVNASILRADCLFALGADNELRYAEALRAYQAISAGENLTPDQKLDVAFKTALALEKTGRVQEAEDALYVNVVLAFVEGRSAGVWFDDRARTFFARAAFRLADRYEQSGEFNQAENILKLVARSRVPASKEARSRIRRIGEKRRLL